MTSTESSVTRVHPPAAGVSWGWTSTAMPALPGARPSSSKRANASGANNDAQQPRTAVATSSGAMSSKDANAPDQVPSPSSSVEDRTTSLGPRSAVHSRSASRAGSRPAAKTAARAAAMPRSRSATWPARIPGPDASTVTTSPGSTPKCRCRASANRAAFAPTRATSSASRSSSDTTRCAWWSVDDDDLVRFVARNKLVPGLGHVEHLLEPYAVLMELAVLGLEGEGHPRLDLHGVVERPDP